MARWYIESRDGESWREISNHFGAWIENYNPVQTFGWSEGGAIRVGDKTLHCFHIPDHHGEKIELFGCWARTTDRLFGVAKDGSLYCPDHPHIVAVLPAETFHPAPSWLK